MSPRTNSGVLASDDLMVRLRGDAPDLVWPARTINPVVDRCAELRRVQPEESHRYEDYDERRAADALRRNWPTALLHARQDASKAFAAAQGWIPAGRDFPASRLVGEVRLRRRMRDLRWAQRSDTFDHEEWYRAGRSVAGVVVHLYSDLALDAIPAGIVVDRLPRSKTTPGEHVGRRGKDHGSDTGTLLRCYQHADHETMLAVVNEPRKVTARAQTG